MMIPRLPLKGILTACLMCLPSLVSAQQQGFASTLQSTLDQSAQSGKFTFVVFHRDNNAATRDFYQQTQTGLLAHGEKAVLTSAKVDDPAERALVEKLGISRAPMPLAVVLAPNGAVTGLFPRTITPDLIASAIVPPTMMQCMKELQNQKLVFVCMTKTDRIDVPEGVRAVQQLPQYKDRISLVGMRVDDPAEARFHQQMKLEPNKVNGPYAVLIAPPGALIGHFDASASTEQIAAAIHKAGQCCNDENCKHNHAPQASGPAGSRR